MMIPEEAEVVGEVGEMVPVSHHRIEALKFVLDD